MTDMHHIAQSLQDAEEALSRGDSDSALASLVEVRESGVTTRALESAISMLRDGDKDPVVDWIRAVSERIEEGDEHPFRELSDDGEFGDVPSNVGLSAIEKELLADFDDVLSEDSDPISIDFALVSNSEAESEGLSPGSGVKDVEDTPASSSKRAPLTDEEKTKLRSSLAERLKAKASTFEETLSTKKAKVVPKGEEEEEAADDESPGPREVVSNQGAVDDFFADLADDVEEDIVEETPLEEVDAGTELGEGLIPQSEYEDPFEDLDEESNVRELTPLGSFKSVSWSEDEDGEELSAEGESPNEEESADAGAPDETESEMDPANPFADLMYLEDDEPEEDSPSKRSYDSGVSQVRYRGVEPPPPTHRLKGGNELGAEESEDFSLEPPADEADVDFDLGFTNPASNETPSSPFGDIDVQKPDSEPDDFDFDLGLSQPQASRGGDAAETKDQDVKETKPGFEPKNEAGETKPKGQEAGREQQPTPLHLGDDESEPIDEDEFFALAESFASEASVENNQPYRGEPMVKRRQRAETPRPKPADQSDNPFAHEAPTGVRHAAVESSFVLEEVDEEGEESVANSAASSQIVTNMSAMVLEARRIYESGDFEEALNLCEKIISRGDSPEAETLMKTIQGEMERVALDALGSLNRTPSLSVDMSDLASMDLDHRAGFLISQIDGMMTFEDIIELSSMSRLETMEVLAVLLRQDIISVD